MTLGRYEGEASLTDRTHSAAKWCVGCGSPMVESRCSNVLCQNFNGSAAYSYKYDEASDSFVPSSYRWPVQRKPRLIWRVLTAPIWILNFLVNGDE